MALFRRAGRVTEYHQGLFLEPSWLAVYLGQGIVPEAWDQRLESVEEGTLRQELATIRRAVRDATAAMPEHAELLARHCGSGRAA